MSWYNVAICAKKGWISLLKRTAHKESSPAYNLLSKGEVFLSCNGNEVIYWSWIKWREESSAEQFVMNHLPDNCDVVMVDEENEVDILRNDLGILGVETVITWNGGSDIETGGADSNDNRDEFLRRLRSMGVEKGKISSIVAIAEEIFSRPKVMF